MTEKTAVRRSASVPYPASACEAPGFTDSGGHGRRTPGVINVALSLRPMRILILTPRLPWPAIDGGRIAMARLTESLASAGADVEILSLNPRKHRVDVPTAPVPWGHPHEACADSTRGSPRPHRRSPATRSSVPSRCGRHRWPAREVEA